MKTMHFLFFFSFILTTVLIIGCGREGGGCADTIAEEKRAADLAELQAKWERYVANVDSVRRVDHSVDAYLRSAWICHCKEEYAQALRYTDTVMVLVTDSVPLSNVNNARYLRSLCFDMLGQMGNAIEETKAIIASDEKKDPYGVIEAKVNLAYYYYQQKREEALAALPDTLMFGGEDVKDNIMKALADRK